MTLRATDRLACQELALVPGTEFETLFRFLPSRDQDMLLSLEALFRTLSDIPRVVSDPSVGVAKLAWWQQELLQAPSEGSQHPVVRALLETGALETLDPDSFGAYLHALVTELQEEPVTDGEALRERLARVAGSEARVLAGPVGFSDGQLEAAGAASRLHELMRTLARGGPAPDWLPMDLVARHQVRNDDRRSPTKSAALVADLAGLARGWRRMAPLAPERARTPGERQLVLRDALVGRRLQRAEARPERWLTHGGRGDLVEVLGAWRLARKLARSSEPPR